MIRQRSFKKCIVLVVMTIGLLSVAITHSGAMELQMAAMGDCSVKMQCCDCTVPEVAAVVESEFIPFQICVPLAARVQNSLIEDHFLYHPPR